MSISLDKLKAFLKLTKLILTCPFFVVLLKFKDLKRCSKITVSLWPLCKRVHRLVNAFPVASAIPDASADISLNYCIRARHSNEVLWTFIVVVRIRVFTACAGMRYDNRSRLVQHPTPPSNQGMRTYITVLK